MTRSWLTLALAVGCLGWAANLPAQNYMPSPVGAARMMDPTPTGPSTSGALTPPLVQGPLTADIAPPGPPLGMDLPANHTSAFQAVNWGPDQGTYFHLGAIALERDHLPGGGIVFNGGAGADVLNPLGLPPTVFTPVYGFNDVNQPMNLGMQGTLGYYWNGQCIELSAMGIFNSSRSRAANLPSGLFVPFTNAPAGFGGDNGLWTEADQVTTGYSSWFISPELNYRYASEAVDETQLILGVRFLSMQEKLGITTIDDISSPQNLLNVATYGVQTRNNLIAPQLGFDWGHTFDKCPILTVGFEAKAAPGVDFSTVQTRLVRGDGYLGFSNTRNEISFGGIYDLDGYIQLNLLERLHLRLGYNALWITGISVASQQVDYNLLNTAGKNNTHGSAFYYGPSLEFEFFF